MKDSTTWVLFFYKDTYY